MPKITNNPAALAHAAAHRAALLLARSRQQPVDSVRAEWHAQQQADFLAWLDAGGFRQMVSTKENSGIAPLFSVPQGDANEELKFTLVRINDAVE